MKKWLLGLVLFLSLAIGFFILECSSNKEDIISPFGDNNNNYSFLTTTPSGSGTNSGSATGSGTSTGTGTNTGSGYACQDIDLYYSLVNTSLTDEAFKINLHTVVRNFTHVSYDYAGEAMQAALDINVRGCTGTFMYCVYTGTCYSGVGTDPYTQMNKEHSWPQSFFDQASIPRGDLHALFPTQGYTNNRRSDYPFGPNAGETYQTTGYPKLSKLGVCTSSSYTGTVFEPPDDHKGDVARAYFYMTVCYYHNYNAPTGDDTVSTGDGTYWATIDSWEETIFRSWNTLDPVDQKERDRNDHICSLYQHNRNPFIDHPEWVDKISDF